MSVPDEAVGVRPPVRLEQVGGAEGLRRLHADQSARGGAPVAAGQLRVGRHRDRAAVLGRRVDGRAPQVGGGQRPGGVVDGDDVDLAALDVGGQRPQRLPLRVVPLRAAVDDPQVVRAEVRAPRPRRRPPGPRAGRPARPGARRSTSRTVRTDRARIGTPSSGSSTLFSSATDPGARSGGEQRRGRRARCSRVLTGAAGPAGRARRRPGRRARAAACAPRRGRP